MALSILTRTKSWTRSRNQSMATGSDSESGSPVQANTPDLSRVTTPALSRVTTRTGHPSTSTLSRMSSRIFSDPGTHEKVETLRQSTRRAGRRVKKEIIQTFEDLGTVGHVYGWAF